MDNNVESFLDLVGMKLAIRRMAETEGFKTYDGNSFQVERDGYIVTMSLEEEYLKFTSNKDYEMMVLSNYNTLYNTIAVEHSMSIKSSIDSMINFLLNDEEE